MPQSWVNRTPMQDSAIQNNNWKYSPNNVSISFIFTDENVFTVATSKTQNHRLYANLLTNQEDVATRRPGKTIYVQSMMASVGDSQITSSWQHTNFDTCQSLSQGQWRVLIVARCCCYRSCQPYVRSQASSSSFSSIHCSGAQGAWGDQLFHHNLIAKCWAILKILS